MNTLDDDTAASQATLAPLAVRKEKAAALLDISVSTFEALARTDPTFPKGRGATPQLVRYDMGELRAWWASRPAANRSPPPNTGARKDRRQ